jgi:hypothetical protein
MSCEQLELVVRILGILCAAVEPYEPYHLFGANVGQCRFCRVVGKVRGGATLIVYEHTPDCLVSLVDELQKQVGGLYERDH